MEQAGTNPIFVTLLCILRCLVPLLILLGISYLLRKMGVIAEPPKPPPEQDDGNNHNTDNGNGGFAHA